MFYILLLNNWIFFQFDLLTSQFSCVLVCTCTLAVYVVLCSQRKEICSPQLINKKFKICFRVQYTVGMSSEHKADQHGQFYKYKILTKIFFHPGGWVGWFPKVLKHQIWRELFLAWFEPLTLPLPPDTLTNWPSDILQTWIENNKIIKHNMVRKMRIKIST